MCFEIQSLLFYCIAIAGQNIWGMIYGFIDALSMSEQFHSH